jgi:hypothetical protein
MGLDRMSDYVNKAPDSDFSDLVEDDEFKKDLIRFFKGGRYSYTDDEIMERGFEGLTKDFVEHMRAQSWNEVTAVKDLNYVKNKNLDQTGKDAFGRLTQAWDSSSAVGSTWGDAIGDFSEAILTAPSTYIGFGAGKLASKVGSKGIQIAVRAGLKQEAQKNVTKKGLKRLASSKVTQEAASGAAGGAALGALQAGAQGETREKIIGGYEYTKKDLIFDSLIGATVGAAGGAVSGALAKSRGKEIDKVLVDRSKEFKKAEEEAAEDALSTLKNASSTSPELKEEALKLVADIEDILAARAGDAKAKRSALDPERVAKGEAILGSMSDPKTNPEFASGLSANTFRSIAAATVDLQKELKIATKGGELKISEAVANMMTEDGASKTFGILDVVRKKYNLSKDEFSLIYLAEASRAGQTLGFQSAIKRGAKVEAKAEADKANANLDILFEKGASSLSSIDAKEITAAAIRNEKKGVGNKTVTFLRDLDTLRVSLMTSQPATTVRNLASTGILVGADMSDQVFKAMFKGITGDTKAIRNIIPDMTSILRGMSTNKVEASLLKQIYLDEMPEASKRVYADAMRIEVGMESNGVLANVGRKFNIGNTLVDTALKETIMYGDLDRQFRAKGLSLTDWLRTNKKLEDIPEGISLDDAAKAANSMTMQDTFRDSTSAVGVTTRALVNLNRKVPFLVSTLAGVPFPRYLGNHIQKMSEYAPLLGEALHRANIIEGAGDKPSLRSILDPRTWDATRSARQATGAMMLWGGYELAEQRQGEVDYGSIKNTLIQEFGDDADLKPLLGATMIHMYVGDQKWRSDNNLPTAFDDPKQFADDMADVLGGIPEFSFELGLAVGPLMALLTEGTAEALEKGGKQIGDFLSTYTMPAAVVRDLVGQGSFESAGTPFTRDLARQNEESMVGAGQTSEEMKNRALRSLPDYDFVQYQQSFNGENDIDYHDFDNPVARGKIDPALKQITGVSQEPPKTELQKAMSRYGIKNYRIYNSSTAKNANIDLVLRKQLSETMYKDFEYWQDNKINTGGGGQLSWSEIEASENFTKEEKKGILESFIKAKIDKKREKVEAEFTAYLAASPIAARGFVRNNYVIYTNKKNGKRNLDLAAKQLGVGSAEEYLGKSDGVPDEIERRMKLLTLADNLVEFKINE